MVLLSETPTAVLDALSEMMPRLEAHESRSGANVHAVGRSFKPGPWAKRQVAEWDRAADARGVKKAPRPADLQKAGIAMRVVSRG